MSEYPIDGLPVVHMQVEEDGHRLAAEGVDVHGIPWRAFAVAERDVLGDYAGRLRVYVGEGLPLVGDVTVHPSCGVGPSDEVQAIASALVWSAIRAVRWARGAD